MDIINFNLSAMHRRFEQDLRSVNWQLRKVGSCFRANEGLQSAIDRIQFLLSSVPIEEWLTSSNREARDFALTWLVPSTLEQIQECFLTGKAISIPGYFYGEVVCYYGWKG